MCMMTMYQAISIQNEEKSKTMKKVLDSLN